MNQNLNTLITDANLRVMTKNSLIHNGGLKTIKDVISAGLGKLKLIRGVGISTLDEIELLMASMGLDWSTDTSYDPQYSIMFKAGHSIKVDQWIADEARRWIADQRLQFKNFTRNGVIVISINLSDVSYIR